MTECNFAENQKRWDGGDVTEEACYAKGYEHACYGWASKGLGFPGTDAQRDAYARGYERGRVYIAVTGTA